MRVINPNNYFFVSFSLIFMLLISGCGGGGNENDDNVFPVITVSTNSESAEALSGFVIDIDVDVPNGDELLELLVFDIPDWAFYDEENRRVFGRPDLASVGEFSITVQASAGIAVTQELFNFEVVDTGNILLSGNIVGSEVSGNVNISLEDFSAIQDSPFPKFSVRFNAPSVPSYSMPIPGDLIESRESTLVLIRVEYRDDSDRLVELVSTLSDIDQLLIMAGDNRELSSEEFPRLSVSALSTARFILSHDENGLLPNTAAELIATENSLLAEDVLNLGALYQFAIDQEILGSSDRSLLDVFLEVNYEPSRVLNNAIEQLNLIEESGLTEDEFFRILDEITTDVSQQSDVTASFIEENLPGMSVMSAPFLSEELPNVISDPLVISVQNTGEIYRRVDEQISLARRFNWRAGDSNFRLNFLTSQESSRTFIDPIELIDLNFDSSTMTFFIDRLEDSETIEIETTDINSQVDVIFTTEDRWHVVVDREVEHSIANAVTAVGGNPTDFPTVRQTIRESRVLLLSSEISNQNLIADDDLQNNTWVIPSRSISEFNDQNLNSANITIVDTYTFNEDGTTSEGDAGGSVLGWQVTENNRIRLESSNRENFEIIPFIQVENRYLGLVIKEVEDAIENISIVEFASTDTDSIARFLEELELPTRTMNSAPFWLQVNGDRRPNNFRDDGLLNVDQINGFLFDSSRDLRQVNGILGPCIQGIEGCFISSTNTNRLENLSNPIRFNRVINPNAPLNEQITETVEWQVISYDAMSETAVVILSIQTNEAVNHFSVAPRILVLQQRNLNEWRDAFFSSPLAIQ